MRSASFLAGCWALLLVGAGSGLLFGQTVQPKKLNLIVCEYDRVVFSDSNVSVTWDDLQKPDNALEVLLDKVQTNRETELAIVFVRPKSVKTYRLVRNLIAKRQIDL